MSTLESASLCVGLSCNRSVYPEMCCHDTSSCRTQCRWANNKTWVYLGMLMYISSFLSRDSVYTAASAQSTAVNTLEMSQFWSLHERNLTSFVTQAYIILRNDSLNSHPQSIVRVLHRWFLYGNKVNHGILYSLVRLSYYSPDCFPPTPSSFEMRCTMVLMSPGCTVHFSIV
jgi:hypothetical protein